VTVGRATARLARRTAIGGERASPLSPLVRNAGEFDLFYDTVYVPFARSRFDEAAAVRGRSLLRRVALGPGGTILLVGQDGRHLAA
jgi:hypothetical protein